jgi:RecA/RadA recombinase
MLKTIPTLGITYTKTPIDRPYTSTRSSHKKVPKDLLNVLQNPQEHPAVSPPTGNTDRKIYLGDGAKNPQQGELHPIWIPSDLLSTHTLIAGGIGAGKTTILFRLIAGAINTGRTVIISEAKAGQNGYADGAAFTDLATYLHQKFPALKLYRWVRGNCWFNPLLYLESPPDRRAFFDSICQQLQAGGGVSGDLVGFVYNAANIADWIVIYLLEFASTNSCTLRSLIKALRDPDYLVAELKAQIDYYKQELTNNPQLVLAQTKLDRLLEIKQQLKRLNFFYLMKPELIMTRHGLNLFTNLFDHEDLLKYSEPQTDLPELQLAEILYERSLVIISQPLYDPASEVVGPLFWDSLLALVVKLGPNPPTRNNHHRQKVIAVLDETHRLPVGRLGESGDFLREYQVGLVEITPTIVDRDRWERNRHIYQTLISLSPGVPEVVELIQDRLPNFIPKAINNTNTSFGNNGQIQTTISRDTNFALRMSEDNPGVSFRSLRMTGRYTGLLQSLHLDGENKVFWIDFEHELFREIKSLLAAGIQPDCAPEVLHSIDYILGLV